MSISTIRPKPVTSRQRPPKADAKATRLPVWRPQPSGLTRDELRRIVMDIVG